MRNTLILGIGNTLLRDEGLGIHLLELLRREPPDVPDVSYLDGGTLSFSLAPAIEDCDSLIVLDAAQLNAKPGTIALFAGDDMDRFIGQGKRSVHEVGLVDLLSIARLQGCLPANRGLLGVQPAECGWGESPSEIVASVLPEAAARVAALLYLWQKQAKL